MVRSSLVYVGILPHLVGHVSSEPNIQQLLSSFLGSAMKGYSWQFIGHGDSRNAGPYVGPQGCRSTHLPGLQPSLSRFPPLVVRVCMAWNTYKTKWMSKLPTNVLTPSADTRKLLIRNLTQSCNDTRRNSRTDWPSSTRSMLVCKLQEHLECWAL